MVKGHLTYRRAGQRGHTGLVNRLAKSGSVKAWPTDVAFYREKRAGAPASARARGHRNYATSWPVASRMNWMSLAASRGALKSRMTLASPALRMLVRSSSSVA
jgi:hypothetical protein